jgi:hypothetical protein
MEVLKLLSREEMRNLNGGYIIDGGSCTLTCDNCRNSTCTAQVDSCTQAAVYQLCGPGFSWQNGPEAVCVC